MNVLLNAILVTVIWIIPVLAGTIVIDRVFPDVREDEGKWYSVLMIQGKTQDKLGERIDRLQ